MLWSPDHYHLTDQVVSDLGLADRMRTAAQWSVQLYSGQGLLKVDQADNNNAEITWSVSLNWSHWSSRTILPLGRPELRLIAHRQIRVLPPTDRHVHTLQPTDTCKLSTDSYVYTRPTTDICINAHPQELGYLQSYKQVHAQPSTDTCIPARYRYVYSRLTDRSIPTRRLIGIFPPSDRYVLQPPSPTQRQIRVYSPTVRYVYQRP